MSKARLETMKAGFLVTRPKKRESYYRNVGILLTIDVIIKNCPLYTNGFFLLV